MAKNEATPPTKTAAQQAQEPISDADQPAAPAQPATAFSDSDHPLRAPEAPVQVHQGPGIREVPPQDVPFADDTVYDDDPDTEPI